MKKRITLIVLLFIFAFQNSYSVTVTWNGGFGFWGQASRWSTGTVPTAIDDVIITNGFVLIPNGLNAFAKTLTVTSSGIFRTNTTGSLTMGNQQDLYLIENHGMFFHFGSIEMSNVTSTDYWSAGGIKNHNLFRTFGGSEINMSAVGRKSIYNLETGNFINNGHIIIIEQTNLSQTIGITNNGTFLNDQVGYIRVDGGTYGVSNTSFAQIFNNKGKIEVNNTSGAPLVNESIFKNFLIGTINVWDRGMYNGGKFENRGLIYILQDSDPFNSFEGLFNSDFFENHGRLTIDTDADRAINNAHDWWGSIPEFENHNELILRNSSEQSILSVGTFVNTESGYVHSDNKIEGGELKNKGIFISTSTRKHDFELMNTGAFNDRYGKLNANSTYNQQLIVDPIKGPLQNGVPYNDILNLVSNSNISFGEWVIDEANPLVAGTYNPNTFLPNGLAVGDDLLFVEVSINGSGLTKYLGLVIDNPIFRMNAEAEENKLPNEPVELTVFPNPCIDQINLNHAGLQDATIEIYNQNGSLAFHKMNVGGDRSEILLPQNLTTGSYLLRLIENQKLIATKKLQVVR